MTIELATTEPLEFTAGDFVTWKIKENTDRTIAGLWVLTYSFVKSGAQFDITCTDNGDNYHLATILAADSAGYAAGNYKWQSYLTKTTERYLVDSGTLTINPNFAILTTGYDGRTHWKIVLDNVEAVIQGRATKDQSSYTINGRQLSRTSIPDLLMLYNKAKSQVASEEKAERIANGLGTSGTIRVRF